MAACRDSHTVVALVPDAGWNLARDVLDAVAPQKNGCPRSSSTAETRHRGALKLKKAPAGKPVLVVIAACGGVTPAQQKKAEALHTVCGVSVVVCGEPASPKRKRQ